MLPQDRHGDQEVFGGCCFGVGSQSSNTHANANSDSEPNAVTNAIADSESNAIADTKPDAVTDAIANSEPGADSYADTDTDTNSFVDFWSSVAVLSYHVD